MYSGIGGSDGIGMGNIILIEEHNFTIESKTISDAETEIGRLEETIERFNTVTNEMADKMEETVGKQDADILRGHVFLLGDPMVKDEIIDTIRNDKISSEEALSHVMDKTAAMFMESDDELIRQRATDLMDIKARMLKMLMGVEDTDISKLPPGTIIVAGDLTPSMTAGINPNNIAGIITEEGGITSHSAILARAMEIPAVLGIKGICSQISNGDKAVLDGSNGTVIINPNEAEISEYKRLYDEYQNEKEHLKSYKGKATRTSDGVQVELVCNIGSPEDVNKVIECDGEGIGLFRTEFLFMDRDAIPTEDEQFEAYMSVAQKLGDRPVIIRTLDIGGDKELPILGLEKEENPFLGFRAIRFCLQREDIYRVQLRALLRASAYGNIKIMVPLVTGVDELRQVKALVRELMKELDAEKISYNRNIEIGVMIETPAAYVMADVLAREASFFSIGTNDLIGYTMAVDRGNSKVAYLYSAYNPAVLRGIKRTIECARAEGIMVGMCGEAAADAALIPLFLSFGLQEFSVSASSILKTRKIISECDMKKAKALEERVMSVTTEEEAAAILKGK